MSLATVPEIGSVVRVRQRHFAVTDVLDSTLPADVDRPFAAPQHLVSLSCVEDDGLGEELRVVWELEPGAESREVRRLPAVDGFDPPDDFDAFLDAVRWGAVSSADRKRLQSPFRSGITIEPYQLEPLARAIEMPRVNLLIADDVGLGKTIEAGLIALELLLRHRARRMLIVCPATLTIQWQQQMQEKFGLRFEIANRDYFRQQRRARGISVNPWSTHPRFIVSIDFLKQARVQGLLEETFDPEPYPRPIDLLIVDEAANVAPSGSGRYARASERTRVIRKLAPRCEHRLFLTATPHNGFAESFTALLELVDDQRFARGVQWDRRQLDRVMIRRMKSAIVDPLGRPVFKEREVCSLDVAFSDAERDAARMLKEYARSREGHADDDTTKQLTQFVLTLLKKRLYSSPEAFAQTLTRHRQTLERPPAPRRLATKGQALRERLRQLERDVPEGADFEEAIDSSLDEARACFAELTPQERTLLAQLGAWADDARERADAKCRRLIDWLDAEIRPNGIWTDRRVIVFTEYRDTLRYLRDQLERRGYRGDRIEELTGATDDDAREAIKQAFQASPSLTPVRILLATDAISEGLDLQLHCSRLIHYEIPWNPNRLEQRNGRIDRHGQKETPVVHHFMPAGFDPARLTVERRSDLEDDLEFLALAVEKVAAIRADLGSYGDVIADHVRRAMLGETGVSLDVESNAELSGRAESARKALTIEQNLRQRTIELRDQVAASERELHLEPEHVRAVVDVALRLCAQPPLGPATTADGGTAYRVGQLTDAWASCARGLEHPITGERRPIVFDRAVVEGRDDVVLAHLQHPLVDRALTFLRAEVWSRGAAALRRATARLADERRLSSPTVVAHGRIVVAGADGKRLHEEVISAACRIDGASVRRLNVGETQAAIEAATPVPVPERDVVRLLELWPAHREQLEAALDARLREVRNGIARELDLRLKSEIRDITERLNELGRQIDLELKVARTERQLSLFGDEREQLNLDLDAIEARRARIPADIEREVAALTRRYETRTPHLFPIAVEYVLPGRPAARG